jgi:hypothetical protein
VAADGTIHASAFDLPPEFISPQAVTFMKLTSRSLAEERMTRASHNCQVSRASR